jgi:replicative superfamily II helicase
VGLIITTHEKWNIIMCKIGSQRLIDKVTLPIIHEIIILQDIRGPVLETITARRKRTALTSGQWIRLTGLCATKPNSENITEFIKVRPDCARAYRDVHRLTRSR